jgi:hypothetical protein
LCLLWRQKTRSPSASTTGTAPTAAGTPDDTISGLVHVGGKTKIRNTQTTVTHDHHVVRLQIPVHDTAPMYEFHAFAHVCEKNRNRFLAVPTEPRISTLKRHLAKWHHDHNFLRPGEHIDEAQDPGMGAQSHDFDFSLN